MKKLICLIILLLLIVLSINYYVIYSTKDNIVKKVSSDIDCILVLGAGIKNQEPSKTLKDRLDKTVELYKEDVSRKIILSGDKHDNYNEPLVMKNYLIEKGVNEENIILDEIGYSTYESIYNIKNIYKYKKIVIVTQKYHLYRALYISKSLGISAIGVSCVNKKYSGNTYREIREVLARNKDFIKCLFNKRCVQAID